MQFIKDNPEKHDQAEWCGTVQCFAGWAVHLEGWEVDNELHATVRKGAVTDRDVEALAIELLGLSRREAFTLFGGGNTIEELERTVRDLVVRERESWMRQQ